MLWSLPTRQVLTWCGYSNSSFNPLIYSIFNKEFRDAFTRILTAHGSCCGHYKPHYHSSRYLYADHYPGSSNSAAGRRKSSYNSSSNEQHGSLGGRCSVCYYCCCCCCLLCSNRHHPSPAAEKFIDNQPE